MKQYPAAVQQGQRRSLLARIEGRDQPEQEADRQDEDAE